MVRKRVCLNCAVVFETYPDTPIDWRFNPARIMENGSIPVASFCSLKCRDEFAEKAPEQMKKIVSSETKGEC